MRADRCIYIIYYEHSTHVYSILYVREKLYVQIDLLRKLYAQAIPWLY